MRSTFRVASIALAATLIVAACGSEESGSGAGAPTETIAAPDTTVAESAPDTTTETSVAPTSEPEQAGQDVEADTAAAEAALLTVADLPDGWTEAVAVADDATAALTARLAECVAVDGDEISSADATAAAGPFASAAADASITQHVGVLASESEARTVVAFTVEPSVLACFEEAYAELAGDALVGAAADGSTFGAPSVTRLQVGPAGDATQAIRVTVPVTGDPAVAAVTVDHVIVRSGRSLATITFTNSTEPTPVESIDAVTAVVAERLPA
jgi:hypothetical protein